MRGEDWIERVDRAEQPSEISRREFLQVSGAGLFVFFVIDATAAFQEPAGQPSYPADFNAYLRIGEDGRVACYAGKTELGQGSQTVLAQVAADELDVSFDAVDVVLGDTEICPWDEGTFGSLTVREFAPVLRGAAAEARAVLLQMAADYLRLPSPDLRVKDGVVTWSKDERRSVSYAQLVKGKRIERHLEKVPLKPVAAFTVVGTAPRRKDALDKVTGKARYAADMILPGMLHARVLRPPAHGATLKAVDTSAAEKIPGIRVVRDNDLIAVLHQQPDTAEQALQLVQAQFELPQSGEDDITIFDHLLKAAPPLRAADEKGSLADGEKLATRMIEETYLNSYVAHAPIETHAAVAKIEGAKLTLWASTQTPFSLRQEAAQAVGFAPENVRAITPYVGGGFGGKTENSSRQAQEAARLAKITGKPVQLMFDRAEEFFYDMFRPAAVVKIRSGTDDKGKLVLWDYRVYGAGADDEHLFYDVPYHRTQFAGGWSDSPAGLQAFAVGPWRAPAANTNTFARESHIDAIASKLGRDPLEFRLMHISNARMRRVLQAATEKSGWKPALGPSGRGIGLACAIYAGTYVATVAEVVVNKRTGGIEVKRVVSAQDQGFTFNPDGSRQQIEGSITMGMGYALGEEVRFKNGAVLDRNFDTYEIPRFSWLPKIETVLIDNPTTPASGCGEPPIVTMGAVLANAVFDATGKRLRQLPMTATRLRVALQQG